MWLSRKLVKAYKSAVQLWLHVENMWKTSSSLFTCGWLNSLSGSAIRAAEMIITQMQVPCLDSIWLSAAPTPNRARTIRGVDRRDCYFICCESDTAALMSSLYLSATGPLCNLRHMKQIELDRYLEFLPSTRTPTIPGQALRAF